MFYFWRSFLRCAHNADNVKADGIVHVPVFDVVVNGAPQVLQFVIVHGIYRFREIVVPPRFHLHKDNHISVQGNEVDVTVPRFPVIVNNCVSFLLKEACGLCFAPLA